MGDSALLTETGQGVLFLDELTSAPQMTQTACYQLVLDRRLGEYSLAPECIVIDHREPVRRSGRALAMPRPLRNRFVHLDLDTDLQEWCHWAIQAQIRPEIVAFLRFKPDFAPSARNARRKCLADTAFL